MESAMKKSFDQNSVAKAIGLVLSSLSQHEMMILYRDLFNNDSKFIPNAHFTASFFELYSVFSETLDRDLIQPLANQNLIKLERQVFMGSYFPPVRRLSTTISNLSAVMDAFRSHTCFSIKCRHKGDHDSETFLIKLLFIYALRTLSKRVEHIEKRIVELS